MKTNMKEAKHFCCEVTMERRFFVTLSDGSNEFDWLLYQLGYKEEECAGINQVRFTADVIEVSE